MANPTTPFNYDYSGFTDDSAYATPCSWDGLNILGARLSILFYFMFLFSVCGNALVLVIIHRFEKLTTVTNILLLNLVVSSLIFMSSLPFMGVYLQLSYWAFGKVMCKIVGTVYYLGFYSSVLFLTLLTIDRHLAVVYSMTASQVRCRSYAVISCAVVWLVSGLACIRPMIIHTTFNRSEETYCQEHRGLELEYIDVGMLRSTGLYLQIILFLIIPLTVFIYCYIRIAITVIKSKIVTKFKTVRLIFVIVLLFFLCWTPYNIALIMNEKADGCHQQMKWGYTLEVTRVIAYIYFCISPLFYTFVGKKFQNYFRQLLVTRFPQLKKHVSVSPQSGSNMSTKSTRNEL